MTFSNGYNPDEDIIEGVFEEIKEELTKPSELDGLSEEELNIKLQELSDHYHRSPAIWNILKSMSNNVFALLQASHEELITMVDTFETYSTKLKDQVTFKKALLVVGYRIKSINEELASINSKWSGRVGVPKDDEFDMLKECTEAYDVLYDRTQAEVVKIVDGLMHTIIDEVPELIEDMKDE